MFLMYEQMLIYSRGNVMLSQPQRRSIWGWVERQTMKLGVEAEPIPCCVPARRFPSCRGLVGGAGRERVQARQQRAHLFGVVETVGRGRLPFGGQATPMTYASGGRQYVVIAAGGYGSADIPVGDALVAFALPEPERSAGKR